jgi:dTDP-glucose 4,6-dehydratase
LIEGIYRLLMSDRNEPCNVGNPAEMTIREFAETVLRLTGSKSTLTFEPLPTDDPKVRQPDISLAKETLGWEPQVSLEKGLAQTIRYFQEAGF